VGIPEGKRPLGRPRIRWEENISMDIEETVWESVDWDDLTQDRDKWPDVMNAVIYIRVFLEYLPKHWFVNKESVART
jgi:hypothetical protein